MGIFAIVGRKLVGIIKLQIGDGDKAKDRRAIV